MWQLYIVLGIETIVLIAGAMLFHNVIEEYQDQHEEDSEKIKMLVKANGIKFQKLEAIEKECNESLQINNYNNIHTTLRKIKELAVGKHN